MDPDCLEDGGKLRILTPWRLQNPSHVPDAFTLQNHRQSHRRCLFWSELLGGDGVLVRGELGSVL